MKKTNLTFSYQIHPEYIAHGLYMGCAYMHGKMVKKSMKYESIWAEDYLNRKFIHGHNNSCQDKIASLH